MKFPNYEGWLDDNEHHFIEVDLMPSDGLIYQTSSNFQMRRRAQTKLLKEMWANCFPDYPMLSRPDPNAMLRECHNSATKVAYFIAHCAVYQHTEKGVDTPARHVLKSIIQDRQVEEQKQMIVPALPAPAQVTVTEVDADAEEEIPA